MKTCIFILFLIMPAIILCQQGDTMPTYFHSPIEVIDQDFLDEYNRLKPKVIKVYPYAMYAADALDDLENDIEGIRKRRKRNKYCKMTYKNLKKDFKYVLLDLYTSEGEVLIKLISRETGVSIYDIIKKYKGKKNAVMFNVMGKIFEQDLKVNYDQKSEAVLEKIIKEIEEGKIIIANEPVLITKEHYKAQEKKLKKIRKANKKYQRSLKKKRRKAKRKKTNIESNNHLSHFEQYS